MKVETADGSLMRVTFKDYGFFVPMDIGGKEIVMEGVEVPEDSILPNAFSIFIPLRKSGQEAHFPAAHYASTHKKFMPILN